MNSMKYCEKIECLELDKKLLDKLKQKNIFIIKEVWRLTRKELKEKSFNDNEINEIIIRLQLRGLDLNKKKY